MNIMGNFSLFYATYERLFILLIGLNRVFYRRECFTAPAKDQLLRKISAKRTVKIKTLESELQCSTEGCKISGTQDRWANRV